MMLEWIMLFNITLSVVMILCLVNLWDAAKNEARHRGGWKKLPWWLWAELILGTPLVSWLAYVGMTGGLL